MAFRVGDHSLKLDAYFIKSGLHRAAGLDYAEGQLIFAFVKMMGDHHIGSEGKPLPGHEGQSAGRQVTGMDPHPGLAGGHRETQPHGVAKIDTGAQAPLHYAGRRYAIQVFDERLDPSHLLS